MLCSMLIHVKVSIKDVKFVISMISFIIIRNLLCLMA